MSKSSELKKSNIRDMLLSLGTIHKNMDGSALKTEYSRFLYFLQSNKADFVKLLEYTRKRIEMYGTATHKIDHMNQKYLVMFWEKIRDIIIDAYSKNKMIDKVK